MSTTPEHASDNHPVRIRARSHAGTLAAIPYLMGFHPHDSLVFLFAHDCRVTLTGRLDLDQAEEFDDLGAYLEHAADLADADQVSLVAYGPDPAAGLLLLDAVRELCPVPVSEVIHATDTHFWAACCSADPRPEPYDVASHEVAAQAVVAGVTALPDRGALTRLARGPAPGDPVCAAADQAAARQLAALGRGQWEALTEALVAHHLADPDAMDATTCAMLAQAVSDITCRDAAWLLMDRPTAEQHLRLWSRVVAHATAEWAIAPLCLLGLAAWIAGNGALLVECVERALATDPSYSLAHLLDDVQRRCLPPWAWDDLKAELVADQRAAGAA